MSYLVFRPRTFVPTCFRLGFAPVDCIVFEDSPSGVKAGVAAGCRVVGIRSSLLDEQLKSHGAVLSVDDWTGVTVDMINTVLDQNGPLRESS
mmetsp:Transcript_52055/g.116911  ORF Transcript_52055/g.116911 Transcript_52055/m.116911 type:complete len:92 (+) Transcript_52055:687-962(+)